MKKFIFILLIILSTTIFTNSGVFQNIAMQYFNYLSQGEYEKAMEISNDIMKKSVNAKQLEAIWKNIEQVYGKLNQILKVSFQTVNQYEVYTITAKFEKINLNVIISVDKDGLIAGLHFNQAEETKWKTPKYANVNLFEIKHVFINSLPGELTIPKNAEKIPAVILIHGSGPNDMDETIGPNKVFKDIAYGLSSNGIAVLRYNKRTLYPEKMSKHDTIKEETIEDVIFAINFLKKQSFVDKIYLLGHSLGAYIAPYMASTNEDVNGLILLGTPARNLEELMIDQFKFLETITKNDYTNYISTLEKLINNEIPETEEILGASAKYFYDLRNYNPQKFIKNLQIPILMIFGKNDYQVSTKEYEIFKEILKDKKNIKIILFDNLTHLFSEGEKSPYEYLKENHVSEDVIQTIINWIKEVDNDDSNNN